MVIPTVLLPRQHSKLLTDNLQNFPQKLGYTAEDAMNVAKQVLIMVYTAAKTAVDASHVPLPPECALEVGLLASYDLGIADAILEGDPGQCCSDVTAQHSAATLMQKPAQKCSVSKDELPPYNLCSFILRAMPAHSDASNSPLADQALAACCLPQGTQPAFDLKCMPLLSRRRMCDKL